MALRPSGSLAVTVTVAVPGVPGASHRMSPDTRAATVPPRLDVAAWVRASSSGSVKWGSRDKATAGPDSVSVCPGTSSTASGGRLQSSPRKSIAASHA